MVDGSLQAQDGVTGVVKLCTPVAAIKNWAVKLALKRTKELLMAYGKDHPKAGQEVGTPEEQIKWKALAKERIRRRKLCMGTSSVKEVLDKQWH
jgi:hypothetical protein